MVLAKRNKKPRQTEYQEQVAFFEYVKCAELFGFEYADKIYIEGKVTLKDTITRQPVSSLQWIHAIRNEGHGDVVRGYRAKRAGLKKGVPDIFLPCPINGFSGLYIELKRPTLKPARKTARGGRSDEQIGFGIWAIESGYAYNVAYGWQEAAETVKSYLGEQ